MKNKRRNRGPSHQRNTKKNQCPMNRAMASLHIVGSDSQIITEEPLVLRFFTSDSEDPDLVQRNEVSGASVAKMLAWTSAATPFIKNGFPGVCSRAKAPLHEDFEITMFMQGGCMFVQVAHEDHGPFLDFGITTQNCSVGQELWDKFGGNGTQPLGPWCVESLSPLVKNVFKPPYQSPMWLLDFQRSLAWMWILVVRSANNLPVTTHQFKDEPLAQ